MVWKDGKSGIHTGRTIRCASRSHLQRREGLLVKSTPNTFDEVSSEDVLYSLGKQNRWLLPEAIKTNSVESRDKMYDDVVLVERYTLDENKKTRDRRPDCLSIYVSENGTTYRPRRKFAHAKNLLTDGEKTKCRYEVAYPPPSGSYPHGRESRNKRSRAHLGQTKKKRNWALEDYLDGLEEEDVSDNNILEDGFDECEQSYVQVRSPLNVDLDLVIKHSSQRSSGSVAPVSDIVESHKNCRDECKNGECIYVGTESEMYDAHLALLAQIRHSSSDSADAPGDDNPTPISKKALKKAKRWQWRRKRRNRRSEHNRNYLAQQAAKQSLIHNDVILNDPVTITLKIEDVSPAALEQQWGNIYTEGSCFPRTFTLDAMRLMPHCTDKMETYVLFQLVNESQAINHIKAFVSLVMSCDKITSERVYLEFLSQIGAREVNKDNWSVEDVMNVVISCFSSESIMARLAIMNYAEPRGPKQSLDSLEEVVGWHSKSFSLKGAHREVRKMLTENTPSGAEKKGNNFEAGNQNGHHSLDCGICFQEFTFEGNDTLPDYTVLMECDHMFCNECWKAHLQTQILHGQTVLRCPGHDCSAMIDDVTVMSLVPSLYGKHVEKRLDSIIEVSPEWKWCPADRCKLVAKTTVLKCPSALWGLSSTKAQPIPVLCSCGSVWCFKCQEDAHWPATCKEAQVFRENNKAYRQLLRTDKKRLITGVEVKNCPSCHYPIEKFQGCDHMFCGLCSTNFCWVCLSSGYDWDHVCRTFIKQRKVELKPEAKQIRTFEHVAVMSRISRSPSLVCNIYKKLDRLEKGLKNFEKLSLWKEEWNCSGSVSSLLNSLSKSNATYHLREAFSFKFQALLALEGTAIMLSFSRDTSGKRILTSEFNRLLFIVERLDEMLQNFSKCCQEESQLKRLQHFVKCGQKCFLSISRKTHRIK